MCTGMTRAWTLYIKDLQLPRSSSLTPFNPLWSDDAQAVGITHSDSRETIEGRESTGVDPLHVWPRIVLNERCASSPSPADVVAIARQIMPLSMEGLGVDAGLWVGCKGRARASRGFSSQQSSRTCTREATRSTRIHVVLPSQDFAVRRDISSSRDGLSRSSNAEI